MERFLVFVLMRIEEKEERKIRRSKNGRYVKEIHIRVVRIPIENSETLSESEKILRSMIESTAFAMDRFRSEAEQPRWERDCARTLQREPAKSNFHDLRTPLSGNMGQVRY
ncbi:MAG: hypothetical protein ACLSXO_00850 [Coprococcus sp.]